MDVLHVSTVMRQVLRPSRLTRLCLLVCSLLALGGCGDSDPTLIFQNREEPLGTVELNLVGQGSQGTLFRLRSAIIMVQGPDQTLFFDSEQNPDATSFSAVVSPGSYSSFLQEGWRLERVQDGKVVVDAALISTNPFFFDVIEGERTRVALRFRAGQDVVVTDPGLLEIVLEVDEEQGPPEPGFCSSDAECGPGATCCIAGFLGTCQALEPGEACPLPDLTVSAEVAQASLIIDQEFFPPNSCAIDEGCVVQSGTRRLLRFSTMTPNIGDTDLVLGDPTGTPGFEFATCHNHFHFNGYARYELVNDIGDIVAVGHKQAFCLLDSTPVGIPGAPAQGRFHCGFQGLTRGWADIYDSSLDCQWVDITDVPDGDYLLRISINPDRVIEESSYDNNTVEVPVTVAPPAPVDPLSACAVPESGPQRECGWDFAPGFEGAKCVPGELVTMGCGCSDAASCSGDPMLRVCKSVEACGAETALGFSDDTCGLCPQLEFTCPDSGVFSLLSGAFSSDLPFACEVKGSAAPPPPSPPPPASPPAAPPTPQPALPN
jgi:lysyl oxidase